MERKKQGRKKQKTKRQGKKEIKHTMVYSKT